MMKKIVIPNKVKDMMKTLEAEGFEVFLIGGAIRDSLLEIEPHDFDLFTDCSDILKVFPQGKVIGGEERQEKILTVIVDDTEISQYRNSGDRKEVGNDIFEHQATCDAFMNCICCKSDGIIHSSNAFNYQGLEDIRDKIVRAVGEPRDRLNEDDGRYFRYLEQADRLGFDIEEETLKAIEEFDTSGVAKERTWISFKKVLPYLKEKHIKYWASEMFPLTWFRTEMEMDGGDFHDETPREHCIYTMQEAQKISNNPLFIMSALFHDIGKARTRTHDFVTGTHFYGHEKEGASLMKKYMLKHLGASTEEINYVHCLIRRHMFGYMIEGNPIKTNTYIKLFNELEENGVTVEELGSLIFCDCHGNKKKNPIKLSESVVKVFEKVTGLEIFNAGNKIIKKFYELKEKETPFKIGDMKFGGKDLITLGMKPGPEFKEILEPLFEMVCDGEIENEFEKLKEFVTIHRGLDE